MNDKNKTEDLIGSLCNELQPVKPRCPYHNIVIWLGASVAYLIGVILFYGLQINFAEKMRDAAFLFEMGMAVAILISSALAASWLSFPDAIQRHGIKMIAVTLFGSFMLWIFANGVEEGMDISVFRLGSCSKGIMVEALPFLALVYLTARGQSTQPYWLMTMNVMAVTALGWIGLRLTCAMYDSMLYGFMNYFLPFAVLGAGFGFFARKIFKW